VYFTVKTKAYNIIISVTVQLPLLFEKIISFCLNSIVEQYNIIAKLGTFIMSHPVFGITGTILAQKALFTVSIFTCVLCIYLELL